MALILMLIIVPSQTFAQKSTGKVFNKDYTGISQIKATLETHEGTLVLDLYFKDAPNTVANFISLAEQGFYNNLMFHRVIQGFMTQGGDPEGDGTGGPGYTIDDEITELKHEPGTLAMANSGPNTSGSQFYISHMAQPHLDGRHTIFGKIISGFDALTRIEKGDIIKSIKIEKIKG